MRKLAVIFVLAVFLPSLVLAWLALRTLQDEQYVLERQQTLLCQNITDRLAGQASDILAGYEREFARQVDSLLADRPATVAVMTTKFDEELRKHWPMAELGFVVSLQRQTVLCPVPSAGPAARQFRLENDAFFCNAEPAEVYWMNPKGAAPQEPPSPNDLSQRAQYSFPNQSAQAGQADLSNVQQLKRRVLPQNSAQQQVLNPDFETPDSKVAVAEAEFRQLIGEAGEGMMARFTQNKLNVMTWYRSPLDPQLVFGARLNLSRISEAMRTLVSTLDEQVQGEICVAVLDDNTRPAGLSHPGFEANWRRPFVSSEIGEALPHWEISAYLLDPGKLARTADTLRATLGLLVALLMLAIGAGGWLITRDLQRELTLARQKTDFVSNVSHELKTPLTSIRMFSELLADERTKDEEKRRSYLSIITAETARLTRLINNVLDFSRMERGEKKYEFQPSDLGGIARVAADNFRPQLEASGFSFSCELPDGPMEVRADRDALAQVILNLLSNAEKYSTGQTKDIALQLRREERPLPHAELRVLDRGSGVPKGVGEKIFEKFYRAHDSLGSGIQGSGLGLTLARQIARAHGGDIAYEARDGGGSCFSLRLPLHSRATPSTS